MSHELTKRAWACRGLQPSERLVLLFAADIARSENGNLLFASTATIATATELNAQTVKRVLKALCDRSALVRREVRANRPTVYEVLPDWVSNTTSEPGQLGSSDNQGGCEKQPDQVSNAPATGCQRDLRTVIEPLDKPLLDDVDAAFDEWDLFADQLGRASLKARTDNRRQALSKILCTHGAASWRAGLERARVTPFVWDGHFLRFDWIVTPDNFAKLIEGAFDERPKKAASSQRFTQNFTRIAFEHAEELERQEDLQRTRPEVRIHAEPRPQTSN